MGAPSERPRPHQPLHRCDADESLPQRADLCERGIAMSADLWSIYTVAHAVGLSVDTIESRIAAGKLAAVQVDGQLMIPLDSLLDYIESIRPSPRLTAREPCEE
jgi:hypothetical protein